MPGLRIALLGQLSAAVAGEQLKLSPAAAVSRWWAYLLLHRQQPLPRRQATFTPCAVRKPPFTPWPAGKPPFTPWPVSTEREALDHLRRQIDVLNHLLLPQAADRPWILADRVNVQRNPAIDHEHDVEEFEGRSGAPASQADGRCLTPRPARMQPARSGRSRCRAPRSQA